MSNVHVKLNCGPCACAGTKVSCRTRRAAVISRMTAGFTSVTVKRAESALFQVSAHLSKLAVSSESLYQLSSYGVNLTLR
jgi:hypothetical protein